MKFKELRRMDRNRLTSLSDGIFAIVMTLLVLEMRVPEFSTTASSFELWQALIGMFPVFLSYTLSFIVLFTYWRAHHFIMSGYAKTIDSKLMSISAIFFFLVALVPFTSVLLGRYSDTQLVVVLFSLHTIALGLVLYWMRNHILFSKTVENRNVTFHSIWLSNIRVAVPIVFAVLAILLSFFSIQLSLILLTLAVIFNLFTKSSKVVEWILMHVFRFKPPQQE